MNDGNFVLFCSRLVNAHEHFLALRICEALGMSKDTVLRHWASARISADASTTDDSALIEIIAGKLSGCDGIRYATIAQDAQVSGSPEAETIPHTHPGYTNTLPMS